jgi:hypothetical protein
LVDSFEIDPEDCNDDNSPHEPSIEINLVTSCEFEKNRTSPLTSTSHTSQRLETITESKHPQLEVSQVNSPMIKPNNLKVLTPASLTLESQDCPDLKMKKKQSAEFVASPDRTHTKGSQKSNINLEIQEEESMSDPESHNPSFEQVSGILESLDYLPDTISEHEDSSLEERSRYSWSRSGHGLQKDIDSFHNNSGGLGQSLGCRSTYKIKGSTDSQPEKTRTLMRGLSTIADIKPSN